MIIPEINIEKLKNILDYRNYPKAIFNLIARYFNKIILAIFAILFIYIIYIWYNVIFNPRWSELRKQEYIKNKEKSIIFRKANFELVASEYEARQKRLQEEPEAPADIFQLKK